MTRIIRLTESDLTKIVKRVIKESDEETKEIRLNILRRCVPDADTLKRYMDKFNYDFTKGELRAGYEHDTKGSFIDSILSDDVIFVGFERSPPLKNIDSYVELLAQYIITDELEDEFSEKIDRWWEEHSMKYYRVMKDILFKMYPKEMEEGWRYYQEETKKIIDFHTK